VLLFLSSFVPPPFIEQHHIRPGWSLDRSGEIVIATQVTGVSPLNHKIRLYVRFINHNRTERPRLGTPIQLFASKSHRLVSEIVSSIPPPISTSNPFHCVFDSAIVNFDTCYFRAIIDNRIRPEYVEVKWVIVRTFFASFELTFSLSFASILLSVIVFRFFRYNKRLFKTWEFSQKMTVNLSVCVLAYDLLGFIPSLIIPSFFALALGEIIRSLLRAFAIFYLLFILNSLLRGRQTLRTVIAFPPVAFTVLFFASNAVFLVSLLHRDIDHVWPAEYDSRPPIHFLIVALLIVLFIWILVLITSLFVLFRGNHKCQSLIIVVIFLPLLICFLWCEVWVHDLRKVTETAVIYAFGNGSINLFCLIAEYLQCPIENEINGQDVFED
jgi:hypothetical protein